MKTDVLIVGVRPTGPAPAGQLVRYGVDFVIFDKKSRSAKWARLSAYPFVLPVEQGKHEKKIIKSYRKNLNKNNFSAIEILSDLMVSSQNYENTCPVNTPQISCLFRSLGFRTNKSRFGFVS